MITRSEKMLKCISPNSQKGVEIGALDKPLVSPVDGYVKYIDYATTEELKISSKRRCPSDMVEVDYVWGDHTLQDLLSDEGKLDYAIASHVLEHVPDFIGWLNEIHSILKPGGMLSLALPHKERCFDYFRNKSSTGDVVDAYIRKARKPSPKAIFEATAQAVSYDGRLAWGGEVDQSMLKEVSSNKDAFLKAKKAFDSDTYQDAHCWVFTPESFFKIIKDLIEMNLFGFRVAQFYNVNGCEFFVTFESVVSSNQETVDSQLCSLPFNIGMSNLEAAVAA